MRMVVKDLPGIAALQRWIVQSALSGEPFVHTINAGAAKGLRMEVLLPRDKGIWTGTCESDFAGVIVNGMRAGDVCYDIGGYRGFLAGVMALQGASKVLVFEPLPANQTALNRLRELNPHLPIEVQPVAVGNIDGVMGLKVMSEASMAKLASSPFQPDARPQELIRVEVRRLDSLVTSGRIPPPNAMKIDVEGAELDVLLGASKVLSDSRPVIFLEAHSAALEVACRHELSKWNYRIQRMETTEPQPEHTRHLIATP